jgi:curli production assembly/transport component CsgG
MKKTIISLAIVSMLSGCAILQSTGEFDKTPELTTQMKGVKKEFDTIPSPSAGRPLSVAVYSFTDKTGQRRPQANIASLSSAVTQGAESFLIQALQNVGQGQWFDVVERVGIDNLTKERLIIRQMREAYEGKDAKPLLPMQFAGIIIEGGIVGYDSSTTSGGVGQRIFGIGKQTQWSTDRVTVSLRAVSVNTGKVLATVTTQKTIMSSADSVSALKFFDAGTQAFEAEAGLTINEPGTYAVKATIEMAVVELIKEGQRKGVWDYKTVVKEPPVSLVPPPQAAPVISSEVRQKEEVKVEEKKDVVVQSQTQSETKTEAAPSASTEVKKETLKDGAELKVTAMQTGVKPTIDLFGARYLKEDSFVYKEANEKSQRTWLLKKGTELYIITPGPEGWHQVRDAEKRKGFVKNSVLGTDKP